MEDYAMNIDKIEPKRAINTLRNEIDNLFDKFIERPLGIITGQVVVPVDIAETDSEIIVKSDLPGMDLNDIDVSISGDILTIKGQKKKDIEQAGKTYHVIERSYGEFSRSIRLPAKVDVEKVKASYKNGVLEIVMPKVEPLQTKKIIIESEQEDEQQAGQQETKEQKKAQ